MEKKQLIDYVNTHFKGNLNNCNTSFSQINKAKAVWWFNIHVSRFEEDVHLFLNTTDHSIWITLPKGFVSNLSDTFKIREDKDAADIEIWADKDERYLLDVKSGGKGFNFSPFVKEIINH